MNLLEYVNNIQNWFMTTEKEHTVYICRPRLGYKAHNSLTGETFYTSKQKQFVVSRFNGEKWIISGKELAENYKIKNIDTISSATIKQLLSADETFDWQKATKTKSCNKLWAIQIPLDIQQAPFIPKGKNTVSYINKIGLLHGSGDFLIADNKLGYPDLMQLRVINGETFSIIFDTQMFNGAITKTKRIVKPAQIREFEQSGNNGISISISKITLQSNLNQKRVAVVKPCVLQIDNSIDTEIRSKINDLIDWFEAQGCSISTDKNFNEITLNSQETLGLFNSKLKQKYKCKIKVSKDLKISEEELYKNEKQHDEIINWVHKTYETQVNNKEKQLKQLLNSQYELIIPAFYIIGQSEEAEDNVQILNIINGQKETVNKTKLNEMVNQGFVTSVK